MANGPPPPPGRALRPCIHQRCTGGRLNPGGHDVLRAQRERAQCTPQKRTRTTNHGYQCSVYGPNTFSPRPQS
eukprot:2180138-Prymnesium_polylepis.1